MVDNYLSGGKSNEADMRGEKREREARLGWRRVFSRSQKFNLSAEGQCVVQPKGQVVLRRERASHSGQSGALPLQGRGRP